jgi:hypothetical protein
MSLEPALLTAMTQAPALEAWRTITQFVWGACSAPLPSAAVAEVARREKLCGQVDNAIAGAAWDLWPDLARLSVEPLVQEPTLRRNSDSVVRFWNDAPAGRAVLILDGLSLREVPWLLTEAPNRGFTLRSAGCRVAEFPAETDPFARGLGFSSRSALDNNSAGKSHRLPGAFTDAGNLPWADATQAISSHERLVYWHHWPDDRLHAIGKESGGVQALTQEARQTLCGDDFWKFVARLATGRRVLITSDHGYAACGQFADVTDKDQHAYLKELYKKGRSVAVSANGNGEPTPNGGWAPPIDLSITSPHGTHKYVLGRRKWKASSGYPTLQHGGLSLLEILTPFIELQASGAA